MPYARFLLMRNLNESIPGIDLYVMKMRGIFKTAVRRTSAPTGSAPATLRDIVPGAARAGGDRVPIRCPEAVSQLKVADREIGNRSSGSVHGRSELCRSDVPSSRVT